ncbi:MAG TPA: helix-hairpin-helix domain-containing protein [Polyangiaceae bacterium]|nr:helix-hairpin-helix domain-containing protein [Polyangiaceae bacterium]
MDTSESPARLPTPAGRASIDGDRAVPVGLAGALRGLIDKARESTWAPVVARGLAIAAGMLALAAIGTATPLSGAGVPVATAAPATAATSPTAPAVASAPAASASAPSAATAPSNGVTADGKIILNQATADDLMKLPRVGPKRAQAILEVRRRLGRFHHPTDLLRVKGIGRKTLRQMLPLLVVDPPTPH